MRVGIMSMQRVVNHGSFMQAYGLQSMIRSLGYEAIFVDYTPSPCARGLRSGGQAFKDWLGRRKADVRFTKAGRNLLLATGVYAPSDLDLKYDSCLPLLGVDPFHRNIGEYVDVLVVGSDEVFNCTQVGPNVGFCEQLLGKGGNCGRTISYAGSFGHTTIADLRKLGLEDRVADCFDSFDRISVRDANSLSILHELGFTDVNSHLDPVLVSGLENNKWKTVELPYRYALVYGYGNRFTREEGEEIRKVAKARGLKLVSVYGHQLFCDENVDCRPDEILGYFTNAEFVVTDTFHGSIFSAIMHKPFASIARGQNSNKLTDLLAKLGFSERLVTEGKSISDILAQDCSFSIADRVRSEEASRSLAYLREGITGFDDKVGGWDSNNG